MVSKKILLACMFGILSFGLIAPIYGQDCDFHFTGEILPKGEVPDFIGYGLWSHKKYTVYWSSSVSGVIALVFTTQSFNAWMYGDHDDFSLAKESDVTGQFTFNSGEDDTYIMYNGNNNLAIVSYTLVCEDIFNPFLPLFLILLTLICVGASIFYYKKKIALHR